jgi:hypothetical protein
MTRKAAFQGGLLHPAIYCRSRWLELFVTIGKSLNTQLDPQ